MTDYSIKILIEKIVDGGKPSVVLSHLQARIEHDLEIFDEMAVTGLILDFEYDNVTVSYPGGGEYKYVMSPDDVSRMKKYYGHAGGKAVRKIKEIARDIYKKVGSSWTRL